MELSGTQKTFFQFFSSLLKSSLNLEHFEKKDYPHSFFRRSIEKQHGKCPQTLFKFEEQHLYHIY